MLETKKELVNVIDLQTYIYIYLRCDMFVKFERMKYIIINMASLKAGPRKNAILKLKDKLQIVTKRACKYVEKHNDKVDRLYKDTLTLLEVCFNC